jgi:hypothetical protein
MLSARSKAWRTYAAGSKVEHFADFCRTHLVQSEDRWARRVPPPAIESWVETATPTDTPKRQKVRVAGTSSLPGCDSNAQPSG